MPNYITAEEMAARLGNLSSTSETWSVLVSAIDAAEAAIENPLSGCGRIFTADTVTTARVFEFESCGGYVDTDDISSTSGLIVSDTAATVYTAYQLEPLNGIGPNGRPWPYTRIRLANQYFVRPTYTGQATVVITAKWGWPSVPTAVKEACRILAADLYHLKDNQFGVAGFGEMGVLMVRENRYVAGLLGPYRRADAVFGIA